MNNLCENIHPPTATLEDWNALQLGGEDGVIIYGRIYNDTKNRFEDGKMICTSLILAQTCKEGVIVTTENSTYLLGKEYIYPTLC